VGSDRGPAPDGQQLTLSRRLVRCGDEVNFSIQVDPCVTSETNFQVFPRYLESCDPKTARHRAGLLAWLDDIPSVPFKLSFDNGSAQVTYTPPHPGNYLARLWTPEKPIYRYFAAVGSDYIVYRMLAYGRHQPPGDGPQMRNAGIPIDWALSVDHLPISLDPHRGHLTKLVEYQRVFGDTVMPFFSTAWEVKANPNVDLGAHIDHAIEQIRSAGLRVERAVLDWAAFPDSVEEYHKRGFDVLDGVIPETEVHRGAPWFPYWMSPDDFLSPEKEPADMLAMIMDFCAGFHFHGPPDFHMLASDCDWGVAAPHADLAAREHALIAKNSHSGPVFVPTLLTFEYVPWGKWPQKAWSKEEQLSFVKSFLDDTAFEHARKYGIVFARCVDIADYLRDHPTPQPRRVLSSITHDWPYDRVWSPEWCNELVDVHRGVLAFNDSLAEIRSRRPFIWAKPTSRELIYYEDSEHQCRFEYACPKPLLWYAYDDRRPRAKFCGRSECDVPDPVIDMTTRISEESFEVCYRIKDSASFADYKLAVWDIPREFACCPLQTNAKEFILVENSDGDCRGILVADLEPGTVVSLSFSRET